MNQAPEKRTVETVLAKGYTFVTWHTVGPQLALVVVSDEVGMVGVLKWGKSRAVHETDEVGTPECVWEGEWC